MKKIMLICAALLTAAVFVVSGGCSRDEGTPEHGNMQGGGSTMEDQGSMMEGHGEMMEHNGEPGDMHEGMEEESPAMQAQHETMEKISGEWARAKGAAQTGKPEDAVSPAEKMSEAAGRLDEFKPHRNRENMAEFQRRSKEFRSLLMRFTADAKINDEQSLRELAPEIDKACNDCHQSFR